MTALLPIISRISFTSLTKVRLQFRVFLAQATMHQGVVYRQGRHITDCRKEVDYGLVQRPHSIRMISIEHPNCFLSCLQRSAKECT